MRATVTALDNNRVKLTVEVDLDEMSEAIDLAAKELSRQVSVKGFRKGKVPKNVLVAHLGGAEVLRSEAIRESLPNFYARAVADTLIDPIGQPQIDITAGEEEGPLVFDAEVEVRPEVAISGHKALRVTIPSPQVSDVEVEAQIDRYRETDAVLREVERPIVSGDLVTMDVKVTKVASEDEPLEMAEYMYTVGSGTITDGVDELILGLKAGETLSVNGNLEPGVVATFDLNLKQVRERELPELSDEWVIENTDWQGADDMRDSILAQLRSRKIVEAQMSQRDAMLMALSDLVPESEVSETLVAAETEERLHDLGHRLGEQNLSFETFLQVTNQTPEVLLEKLREDARRAVRIDLGLRAIAREEGLEPTPEEIDEELEKTAASMATDADVLRTNLRDTGRTVAFSAEVAKMKASRWLLEHVTFVDPQGVEVNRELLSQDQSGELGA
ncbi:MAG TPA: trigger factor [Acidimicrobiales bacterium]|nr:trigger factor [Acidimicrobiales bacterium]